MTYTRGTHPNSSVLGKSWAPHGTFTVSKICSECCLPFEAVGSGAHHRKKCDACRTPKPCQGCGCFVKSGGQWCSPCHPGRKISIGNTLRGKKHPDWSEARKGIPRLEMRGRASPLKGRIRPNLSLANLNSDVQQRRYQSQRRNGNLGTSRPERWLGDFLQVPLECRRVWFKGIGEIDLVDWRFKIAVEHQGCYFHACPIHFPNHPRKVQIHARTNYKRESMEALGWTFIEIWEHEVHPWLPRKTV